ncbi:ParB/RepB/Spo0J family partition protein [Streptomyces ficellus]|uniref:ParB/RepB/Spo0J family partition protein n=1 Tax=Streptomyces ficellus TaxID=1977088 RepID=A0ABT7Z3R2_9ACTN|nr:ParB/RepB/Spo0J family partition protein [Streptomyces ficellus]MDN3294076.1 ParB/RepB/Spo0J family partition protein [Streptomyces ficellus]
MEKVPVRALRTADSPRLTRISEEHVRLLAETGTALPPIVVHRATMRVIDGTHRVHAALLRGDEEIGVRFFDGDARDAFVFAVRSNITHGLPLRIAERTSAARRIIGTHPHWSDRAIAEAVGLTAKTVAGVRRSSTEEGPQSNSRVGKDGRVRPLDGAAGRLHAHKLLLRNPEMPLRLIAQEAGISISTVWDVRARIKRGEDPVPPRQRKMMAAAAEERPQRAGSARAGSREEDAGRGAGTVARQEAHASESVVSETLERLRKDPSLRFSAAGRDFLRWVESRVISPQEWSQFIDRLPPHQANLIVEIARKNAGLWRDFAEQLRARQALVESAAEVD